MRDQNVLWRAGIAPDRHAAGPVLHTRDRLKGQLLLRLLMGLSILLLAFAPRASDPANSGHSALVLSANHQNYALLPIPLRIGSEPRARNNQGDIYRRALPTALAVASLDSYGRTASSPGAIPIPATFFDSLCRNGFRQACQLVDLPPPSAMA